MKRVTKKIIGALMATCIMCSGFQMVSYAGSNMFESTYEGVYYQLRISATKNNVTGNISIGTGQRLEVTVTAREYSISGGTYTNQTRSAMIKSGTDVTVSIKPANNCYFVEGTGTYYINGTKIRTMSAQV